jgi:hypothetical protein
MSEIWTKHQLSLGKKEGRDAKGAVGRKRKEGKRDNIWKENRNYKRKQRNVGRDTKRGIVKNKKNGRTDSK